MKHRFFLDWSPLPLAPIGPLAGGDEGALSSTELYLTGETSSSFEAQLKAFRQKTPSLTKDEAALEDMDLADLSAAIQKTKGNVVFFDAPTMRQVVTNWLDGNAARQISLRRTPQGLVFVGITDASDISETQDIVGVVTVLAELVRLQSPTLVGGQTRLDEDVKAITVPTAYVRPVEIPEPAFSPDIVELKQKTEALLQGVFLPEGDDQSDVLLDHLDLLAARYARIFEENVLLLDHLLAADGDLQTTEDRDGA